MRKIIIPIVLLFVTISIIKSQNASNGSSNDAALTMSQLRKTSAFTVNKERRELLEKIQIYADSLSYKTFDKYLISPDQTSIEMEKSNPILYCYRNAFDSILFQVKNTKVEKGTVAIWLLYNMGIVVKTPSSCFGIDINHRWAEKFEPYLDFICVTHNHEDHKSLGLMQIMSSHNKPVLSNFFEPGNKYCSTTPATYKIGNISIRTDITDHNTKLLNFISVYRIDCGDDTGNFTILHCGDSDFKPTQFTHVQGGKVNLLVLRNGSLAENNIIGTESGQVKTNYAFLSHIIELRHRIGVSPHRFPVIETLDHTSQINCNHTIMPFWGEKFVWKNGKLNQMLR